MPQPQGLQDEHGQQRGQQIARRRQQEHRGPSRMGGEQRGERHQQRRRALGGVQQAVIGRRRRAEEAREEYDAGALPEPEHQKGRLVAMGEDPSGDRHDGDRRTGAKARRGQAARQATAAGKPFGRLTDGGCVDDAGAEAADRGTDIEQRQAVRERLARPAGADQHAAQGSGCAGAGPVDPRTRQRQRPGFHQHEDREGGLYRRLAPVKAGVDRRHEQSPAVLQVGDHHHANNAEYKLMPGSDAARLRFLHFLPNFHSR
jgi:hypothetical protein